MADEVTITVPITMRTSAIGVRDDQERYLAALRGNRKGLLARAYISAL